MMFRKLFFSCARKSSNDHPKSTLRRNCDILHIYKVIQLIYTIVSMSRGIVLGFMQEILSAIGIQYRISQRKTRNRWNYINNALKNKLLTYNTIFFIAKQ